MPTSKPRTTALSTDEKIAQLADEIDLLQKRLERELLSEALALIEPKTSKKRKIFKPSRITAYKIQVLTIKHNKLKNLKTRFSRSVMESVQNMGDMPYSQLLHLSTEERKAKDIEIKRMLVKNLHTNIVERVIAGDVAKAQELLNTKKKLEKELART